MHSNTRSQVHSWNNLMVAFGASYYWALTKKVQESGGNYFMDANAYGQYIHAIKRATLAGVPHGLITCSLAPL